MDLLTEDLADHDITIKLATCKKLCVVASALGPAKVLSELVPYLTEYVRTSHDDEVLACIGDELAGLAALCAEKTAALTPLEILCNAEETLVREAAVRSLNTLIGTLSNEEVETQVLPLLDKLTAEAWWSGRVSAAGIFHAAYPKLSAAAKEALRTNFFQLSKDDTPMVRRALAVVVGKMFAVVEPELVDAQLVPTFTRLNNDDQDTVRILVVDSAVELCAELPKEALTEHIYPLLTKFSNDPSWRVRIQLCKNFDKLCTTLESAILLPFYISALGDAEPDVRRIAATQLSAVGTVVGDAALLESAGLFDKIKPLVEEGAQTVKVTIAHQLCKLSQIVGKVVTCKHILPFIAALMHDEIPEVRIAVMEDVSELVQVAGSEHATATIPFTEMGRDSAWRVRYALVQAMPAMGSLMGRKDFEKNLMWLVSECMQDDVHAVRDAAFKSLALLHNGLGAEFTEAVTLPKIMSTSEDKSYLVRQMSAHGVRHLLDAKVDAKLLAGLAPCLLTLANDKVPNVVCVAIDAICGLVSADVLEADVVAKQVKPLLTTLATHADSEVVFLAAEALKRC